MTIRLPRMGWPIPQGGWHGVTAKISNDRSRKQKGKISNGHLAILRDPPPKIETRYCGTQGEPFLVLRSVKIVSQPSF